MRLRQYRKAIESLAASLPDTASTSITFDERPADQVFVKGTFVFLDGSELHFMEFLYDDATKIVKDKYSYHYMKSGRLVFRYDNALDPKARPLATYPNHKHEGKKLLPAVEPTLKKVIEEIERHLLV